MTPDTTKLPLDPLWVEGQFFYLGAGSKLPTGSFQVVSLGDDQPADFSATM